MPIQPIQPISPELQQPEAPRAVTASEEQAYQEQEALEKYIVGLREELDEVYQRAAGHEAALESLRLRGGMLERALSVLDDAAPAPAIPGASMGAPAGKYVKG